jgi:hypothetical protein
MGSGRAEWKAGRAEKVRQSAAALVADFFRRPG